VSRLCDRDDETCVGREEVLPPPHDVTLRSMDMPAGTCTLPEVTVCAAPTGENRSRDSDHTCALATSNMAHVTVSLQGPPPFSPNSIPLSRGLLHLCNSLRREDGNFSKFSELHYWTVSTRTPNVQHDLQAILLFYIFIAFLQSTQDT
jgi:hypothetical protein